jgi:hypothetical protein
MSRNTSMNVLVGYWWPQRYLLLGREAFEKSLVSLACLVIQFDLAFENCKNRKG